MPNPQSGLIGELKFQGQRANAPILGARACTSISLVIAANMLNMNDEEFNKTFGPAALDPKKASSKIAKQELDSCVQTGINFNKAISTGFLNTISRKDMQDIREHFPKLNSNFRNVDKLEFLEGSEVRIKDKPELMEIFPRTLKDFHDELQNKSDAQNFAFVMTAAGHTTTFFSRKNENGEDYFYLADSRNTSFGGALEVYDNWDAAYARLLEKWKGHPQDYVAVSAFARDPNKLRAEEKHKQVLVPSQTKKIDDAVRGVEDYINTTQDSSSLFKSNDKTKAKIYSALLKNAKSELEKQAIIYAILNNNSLKSLRKSVFMALGFFTDNETHDLSTAKEYILNMLKHELRYLNKPEKDFAKLLDENVCKVINKNVNQNVDPSSSRYKPIDDSFSEWLHEIERIKTNAKAKVSKIVTFPNPTQKVQERAILGLLDTNKYLKDRFENPMDSYINYAFPDYDSELNYRQFRNADTRVSPTEKIVLLGLFDIDEQSDTNMDTVIAATLLVKLFDNAYLNQLNSQFLTVQAKIISQNPPNEAKMALLADKSLEELGILMNASIFNIIAQCKSYIKQNTSKENVLDLESIKKTIDAWQPDMSPVDDYRTIQHNEDKGLKSLGEGKWRDAFFEFQLVTERTGKTLAEVIGLDDAIKLVLNVSVPIRITKQSDQSTLFKASGLNYNPQAESYDIVAAEIIEFCMANQREALHLSSDRLVDLADLINLPYIKSPQLTSVEDRCFQSLFFAKEALIKAGENNDEHEKAQQCIIRITTSLFNEYISHGEIKSNKQWKELDAIHFNPETISDVCLGCLNVIALQSNQRSSLSNVDKLFKLIRWLTENNIDFTFIDKTIDFLNTKQDVLTDSVKVQIKKIIEKSLSQINDKTPIEVLPDFLKSVAKYGETNPAPELLEKTINIAKNKVDSMKHTSSELSLDNDNNPVSNVELNGLIRNLEQLRDQGSSKRSSIKP
jgi:hypothetical protein